MAPSTIPNGFKVALVLINCLLILLQIVINFLYVFKYLWVKQGKFRRAIKLMIIFLIFAPIINFYEYFYNFLFLINDNMENFNKNKAMYFLSKLLQVIYSVIQDTIYIVFGLNFICIDITMDQKNNTAKRIIQNINRKKQLVINFVRMTIFLSVMFLISIIMGNNDYISAQNILKMIYYILHSLISDPFEIYIRLYYIIIAKRMLSKYSVIKSEKKLQVILIVNYVAIVW